MKPDDFQKVQRMIDKAKADFERSIERAKTEVDRRISAAINNSLKFKVKKLGDTPTDMKQLVPKDYLLQKLALYFPLAGGTLDDGANIAVGSATGTKIGTSTSQKLGFYGKTPIVQQSNTAGNVSAGATYGANEQKMLNDAYSVLRNLGLLS